MDGDPAPPPPSGILDATRPAEPGDPTPPPPPATLPPHPSGRASLALAVVALACFVIALVLLAIPVRTPGVQDCGTPGAYLAQGRVDVVPDADGRFLDADGEVVTLDAAAVQRALDHPCQERVARLAVPAGILVLAGTVLGLVAFAVEVLVVRPRRRTAWRVAAGVPSEPTRRTRG